MEMSDWSSDVCSSDLKLWSTRAHRRTQEQNGHRACNRPRHCMTPAQNLIARPSFHSGSLSALTQLSSCAAVTEVELQACMVHCTSFPILLFVAHDKLLCLPQSHSCCQLCVAMLISETHALTKTHLVQGLWGGKRPARGTALARTQMRCAVGISQKIWRVPFAGPRPGAGFNAN